MRAIRIHAPGGPEVLRAEDVPVPLPAAGQVAVRLIASGVNFIDVYHRTGLYPQPLPFTPGSEGAGIVEAVGEGVTSVRIGDPVASAELRGAYAEVALAPEGRLVPVPAGLDLRLAAGALLQGMTAHYLACTTRPLQQGDTCLVHAAAGGAGRLLVQVAKLRGARVIGTVSTEAKERIARDAGADHVIRYTEKPEFDVEVRALTAGKGVEVVYDSVGATTWERSLASLAPRGMLVLYGQSSGMVPPFSPSLLAQKGSLFLTRPVLFHYVADRAELLARAGDVFRWIADGRMSLRLDRELPLAEAAEAHRLLESRATSGKILLVP